MKFGKELFQTKLLSRLSHKICPLLSSTGLLRSTFTNNPVSQFAGQSPVCCEWSFLTFDKINGFWRHGNFGIDFTEQFQHFSLQAIRSSVHNRAHVRLGLKKFKYKNPFSYLHFRSRTSSVQSVFFPIFKCPSNRTRSKKFVRHV